ncbi:MAG: GTPase HflX [Oligoflexia bacterium]|nr:GTPase HflX [Oligoflexia bacterium]
MLEKFSIPTESKATLVSIVCPGFKGHSTLDETEKSLDELRELLRTLGVVPQEQFIQHRKKLEAATVIGTGKLEDIAKKAKEDGSLFLALDFEITASQAKNLKKMTGMEVVDRCSIILEIFAKHAHTKEAKTQIEISRLEYMLPRLTALWTHFTRIRGGIGHRTGEGEQQLELDRRYVRERIRHYKKQLESVVISREEQRKRRTQNVISAAIVGYTNAGKSSLLNRLCKVDILEEDKLFSTLDSTCRTLNPDSKPPMVLVDTVGLLSNLPTQLISGFKSTLESAEFADLLVIVCDISDKNHDRHLNVVYEFLNELGIGDKEKFVVFNKSDRLLTMEEKLNAKLMLRTHPHSFLVSTFDDQDMIKLREYIIDFFLSKQKHYELLVPYADGEAHSQVTSKTNVISRTESESGIIYKVRAPEFIFLPLGLNKYLISTSSTSPTSTF